MNARTVSTLLALSSFQVMTASADAETPTQQGNFAGSGTASTVPENVKKSDDNVIKISDANWPPYFFAGQPNKPKGLGREILDECLKNQKRTLEFKFYPIARMFEYLKNGKLDLNILSHVAERESYVQYGKEVVFSESYHAFAPSSKKFSAKQQEDLDTLRMGHLVGLTTTQAFDAYVEKRKQKKSLTSVMTPEAGFDMLLSGRIDVFVETRETFLWLKKENPRLGNIVELELPIKDADYFVAQSKLSPRFADKPLYVESIDTCLRQMKKDGSYDKILARYGLK